MPGSVGRRVYMVCTVIELLGDFPVVQICVTAEPAESPKKVEKDRKVHDFRLR